MTEAAGIIELFSRLCDKYTPPVQRVSCRQSVNRDRVKSCLRRKLYDTLFEFLKNKERNKTTASESYNDETVKTEVWWQILRLRQNRNFDDAANLESLYDKLVSLSTDTDVTTAVLLVLLRLKGSGGSQQKQPLGHGDCKLPVIPSRKSSHVLPEGPLCHGDTVVIQPDRCFYTHYPRRVFEAEPLVCTTAENDMQLCDMPPGTGLLGNSFFSVGGCLGDQHEKTTSESLFGGLVQSRVTSLDMKLELPELPDELDSRHFEIRIPKSFSSMSMEMSDEGFKSQESSMTSSSPDMAAAHDESLDSAYQSDYDTAIYEDCLTMKLPHYYTWETIGLGPGPRMKPFLSEAGPQAFDHWTQHMGTIMETAFPGKHRASRVQVSQKSLVLDVLNVMIAVPSMNFMLDLTEQCFSMREGIYISDTTPEALENLLNDFLICGMYYYRLDLFSTSPLLNSFYHAGLTFRAFTDSIQSVLQYYRAAVLSAPHSFTLLQLRVHFHKLASELRFLARLCSCESPVTEESKASFHTGIQLLSYVYNQTLEASFTDNYPLMVSILRNTCGPYLLFVQKWVYHGIFHDCYGEFMIEVNDDYLQYKDKHFWSHGYTLTTPAVEDSVPAFLRIMARDIFVCGKSINLLKNVFRNHFLCDVDYSEVPHISLTLSMSELLTLTDQCTIYNSKMQQIASQYKLAKTQDKERKQRAKQELFTQGRLKLVMEQKLLDDKVMERKKAAETKKRAELQFLKSQMEDERKRRVAVKEQVLQEDRDYMDRVMRNESALTDEELRLEQEAREELVAQYGELMAGATRREEKALWRVRRAKLDIAREQFLLDEERRWAEDMENSKTDPAGYRVTEPVQAQALDILSGPLPAWAQRASDATVHVLEGDEEDEEVQPPELTSDKSLPQWALKGLQKYGISLKMSPLKSPGSQPLPAAGRRTHVRRSLDNSFTANEETEEVQQRPNVHTFSDRHATTETTGEVSLRPHVKMSIDRHATTESKNEEVVERPHIKSIHGRSALQETESEETMRPHLKSFPDKHANMQSQEPDYSGVPKLKQGISRATEETTQSEWIVKSANQYGHVSQRSELPEASFPRMKKTNLMSASRESTMTYDFGIKPRIRINKLNQASTETEETLESIPRLKMSNQMSATKESEYVDHDKLRNQMFKERNLHGHATDSTVQKLLYNGKYEEQSGDKSTDVIQKVIPSNADLVWMDDKVESYADKFDFLGNAPKTHLMQQFPSMHYAEMFGNHGNHDDIEDFQFLPLPSVIQASVTAPLEAQVMLVNRSIVDYYLTELEIVKHFEALRRYLCMGDGEFSQILSDLLMEKLGTNPRPQNLISPMFLNNCLNKAIRLSVNVDDKYADNLSFIHKYLPKVIEYTSPDLLDCIQLHYEVKWPLNIVITDSSLLKYCKVFSFMLQLKRVVWTLKDFWYRLKRDGIVHSVDRSAHFRQLHLYRQEMQHFIKVMQEYIAHQVVQVTWQEFQTALKEDVHNLDDLHDAHERYIDKANFRCLLTKNAASLMKIIQNIFCLILKFHRQLSMGCWHEGSAGVSTHRNFAQMSQTYKVFHEHTAFLFKVVRKLAVRGYEPHLHDLLLRLNFNNFYDK